MDATVDHYAEAFTIIPGRCFRMIQLPGVDHPTHCSQPVAAHGRFRAADDRLYRVDACEGHADDLTAPLHSLRSKLL
jgi:hypothetical protein